MRTTANLYNRLIIVGNGFDLSMGLKTSYGDFIFNYIKNIIENHLDSNYSYLGELMNIKINSNEDSIRRITSVAFSKTENIDYLKKFSGDFNVIGIGSFMEKIINDLIGYKWVDIENIYFETIKKHFEGYKKGQMQSMYEVLKGINSKMDLLTTSLRDYILTQQIKIEKSSETKYSSLIQILSSPLENTFFQNTWARKKLRNILWNRLGVNFESYPYKTTFLNFNYTNTIDQFVHVFKIGKRVDVIPIHGTVYDDKNPIIFGYGDDTGDIYREMEDVQELGLFKKIKSFNYTRNNNYHKLLSFIEFLPYEVFILGHSCGISDRTMLKTIFEHDNCKAIYRFHYKETEEEAREEDFERGIEIARHFSDKISMRKKMLPFDPEAHIPQVKKD